MMSAISRLKAGEERLLRDKRVRTAVLVVLVLLCLAATVYLDFVLRTEVVYSHLFYLPVALAGLWWGRRGVWLAVSLGVLLVVSCLVSGVDAPMLGCLLRAVILVAVGLTVGTLRDRTVRSAQRTRRLNTVLRAIRNVNQLITQEKDRARLVKEACEFLVGGRGYTTAWMAVFDDAGGLPTTAEAGLGEAFEAMADRLKRDEFPPCVRRATAEAGVVVTSDPHAACADCPLSAVCGAGAAMTVRLKHDETVYGALSVSIPPDIAADEEEHALLVEVATDLAFALHDIELEDERRWARERIAHLNAVLRAIRNVNQLITHETDRDRLLNRACELLVETPGYGDAWIVLLDAAGGVVTTAGAGLGDAFEQIADRLRRGELPACVRRATAQTGVVAVEDPSVTCAGCPLAGTYEGRAGMSIRLEHRGRLHGALTVSLPADHVMDEDEQDLFREVAGDLAFALHDIELTKERERAGAAVRESERRYRALLDNVNLVAVGLDERGRVNYANPFLLSLTGYTREEIIGREWFDLFVPERFRPAVDVVFAELLEREFHPHYENPILTKSGEERLIAWNNTVLRDADGRVCGTMSIGEDITERKRAEEALRESEERFRNLMHHLPGVSVQGYGTDGTVFYWNKASEDVYGYSAEEAIGRDLGDLIIPPDVMPHFRNALELGRRVTQSGEFQPAGELMLLHKDGRLVPVYSIHTAVCVEGKAPLLFCIDVDLSERKRAEAERLRLAMAVEQAAEAVVIRDADRVIRYVNPAFERMTGYARDEVVGADPRAFRGGVHDDAFFDEVWATVARDGVWTGRITNRRKDGALVETEATVSAVRDASGAITNYVSLKRDITREVQLEEQLRQAAKMEAIGQLAGGIAHDFNNLLAGILGYATVITEETDAGSPTHSAAATIARTTRRAADLAQQLLGFARRGKFRNEPIDLHRTVDDVIHLLRRTIDKRIAISSHFAPEQVVVLGDPGQMEQVFLNLGLNARDAMATGGELTFEARVVDVAEDDPTKDPAAPPGRYVMVSVADTGHGIAEGIRDRIFEPFFTTKEPGEGTGMGLATVYGIVTNHGGWVRVESEPGHGATFTVALPLAEEGTPAPAEGEAAAPISGSGRILVVDDEEVVRQTLCRMLGLLGYETADAADGAEAVARYQEPGRDFDLVIVDLVMPKMDGWQCCRALREIDPDVHLIVSTGYGAGGAAEQALAEGVAGFLQKPYRLARLAEVVANAMSE